MSLTGTYQAAMTAAKGYRNVRADERDGKLYIIGTVNTEDEKNRIWNAIKTVPTWQKDVVADIRVIRSHKRNRPSPRSGISMRADATGKLLHTAAVATLLLV